MDWIILLVIVAALLAVFALKRAGQVPVDVARRHLGEGAVVIDVRSPGEFSRGHLPGAVNVPLGEIARGIEKVAPDRNTVVLLHCLSGARSGMAARALRGLGYSRAFNLGSYGRAEEILKGGRGGT